MPTHDVCESNKLKRYSDSIWLDIFVSVRMIFCVDDDIQLYANILSLRTKRNISFAQLC